MITGPNGPTVGRRLRTKAVVAACLILAVLFVAVPASAQTVALWHSLPAGSATDTFNEIVDEFQTANPGIEVEATRVGGYVAGQERFLVAFAAGAPPNIAHFEQTRSAAPYYSGALLSIEPYVNGPDGIDLSDFSPSMLGAVTYEGVLYGLPYNNSTPLLYFNRDLFREAGLEPVAPRTWDEILAVSQSIARDIDGDGQTDIFGIDFYSWGWIFEGWIGQNGARMMNEAGTAFTFNSEAAIEAMEFTQSLVHEHRVAYIPPPSGYTLFWAGELAMGERSTASLGNNIRQAQANGIDMSAAPLACNVECYAPVGGGNLFLVNTGTPDEQQAAWLLLKHLTSTEQHARFSAASGYMGARRSAFRSEILEAQFAEHPEYRATYEQIDVAYARPKVPFWQSDVAGELGRLYDIQMEQNGNVRQTLNQIVEQANARLRQFLETGR